MSEQKTKMKLSKQENTEIGKIALKQNRCEITLSSPNPSNTLQ
jgi:hypothetical protein